MKAVTQEEWHSLRPDEQMCLKLDFMATKCGSIELQNRMRSLKDRIETADTISAGIVTEYQDIDKAYKQAQAAATAQAAFTKTKTKKSARKPPKPRRKLNKRQLAVREAYSRIKQGDVQFEGSDAKFISLGNPHFKELVNKITDEMGDNLEIS